MSGLAVASRPPCPGKISLWKSTAGVALPWGVPKTTRKRQDPGWIWKNRPCGPGRYPAFGGRSGRGRLGFSASQIHRRIQAAARTAGLAGPFQDHAASVSLALDLAAGGDELPEAMQAGRWTSSTMPDRSVRHQAVSRGAGGGLRRSFMRTRRCPLGKGTAGRRSPRNCPPSYGDRCFRGTL